MITRSANELPRALMEAKANGTGLFPVPLIRIGFDVRRRGRMSAPRLLPPAPPHAKVRKSHRGSRAPHHGAPARLPPQPLLRLAHGDARPLLAAPLARQTAGRVLDFVPLIRNARTVLLP